MFRWRAAIGNRGVEFQANPAVQRAIGQRAKVVEYSRLRSEQNSLFKLFELEGRPGVLLGASLLPLDCRIISSQ